MPDQPLFRILRTAAFAVVCVALAAVGHATMSGTGVPLWAFAAGVLSVFALAGPLTARERSLPGITGGVLLAQLGLHQLFAWASHGAPALVHGAHAPGPWTARLFCGGPLAGFPESAADPGWPGTTPADLAASLGIDPSVAAAVMHPGAHGHTAVELARQTAHGGPGMLLAHLGAALLVAWWLRRGEATLWSLLRWLQVTAAAPVRAVRSLRIVSALMAGWCTPDLPAPGRHRLRPIRLPVIALRHTVIRRGPPPPVMPAFLLSA